MTSEMSQSQNDKPVWLHLYEVSKVVKIIETESRRVVAKDWDQERRGSWCLSELGFQFCKIKSSRDLLHNIVDT